MAPAVDVVGDLDRQRRRDLAGELEVVQLHFADDTRSRRRKRRGHGGRSAGAPGPFVLCGQAVEEIVVDDVKRDLRDRRTGKVAPLAQRQLVVLRDGERDRVRRERRQLGGGPVAPTAMPRTLATERRRFRFIPALAGLGRHVGATSRADRLRRRRLGGGVAYGKSARNRRTAPQQENWRPGRPPPCRAGPLAGATSRDSRAWPGGRPGRPAGRDRRRASSRAPRRGAAWESGRGSRRTRGGETPRRPSAASACAAPRCARAAAARRRTSRAWPRPGSTARGRRSRTVRATRGSRTCACRQRRRRP